MRIHDYAIPSATCENLADISGSYQASGTTVEWCDPATSGGGVFKTIGTWRTPGGVPNLMNPPGLNILAVSGNPAVLSLAAPPFPVSMAVGQKAVVSGLTGNGCGALNGAHTVTAVDSYALTIAADATGCSFGGAGAVYSNDFVYRLHIDRTLNQVIGEVWDVDGSQHTVNAQPIANVIDPSYPQSGLMLGQNTTLDLAFVRWCKGVIPVGAPAPWGTASTACSGGTPIGDWEFENNGADSSGYGLNVTFSPSGSLGSPPVPYPNSPAYPPACNPGAQQSFRAGKSAQLDGSLSFPLDGGTSLTYLWQNTLSTEPGVNTQHLRWSSHLISKPTVSGFVFGPANFRLTVTDGSGQSTSCMVHDGAVATDDSGNVAIRDQKTASILGPLTQWNHPNNRWPWADNIAKAWADRMGSYQGNIIPGGVVTEFVDAWNTARAGTVDCTQGSPTCTGHGTQFQTLFCGGAGNTKPVINTYFIGWYTYPIAGGGGGTGRRYYQVSGCPSQTSLTIGGTWSPASENGMQYAYWTDPGLGAWANGGANINYYDNVLAFYSMYYRSGIDSYLHYARWLADRWWTNPVILDRGNCHDNQPGRCAFPRITALTGVFLRAIDQDNIAGSPNSSPMWAGLRRIMDLTFIYEVTIASQYNQPIGDLRETAYSGMYVALCGAYDPDPVHAAACRAVVNTSILTTWRGQRLPDGHWQGIAANYNSSFFGYFGALEPGTVTVAPGSNIVTISGGTWDSSWFPASFFSVAVPTDYTTRDSGYYNASYVDATHIRLDRGYTDNCSSGTNSCSNRQWMLSTPGTWVGYVTQPFMLGIAGHYFNQAYIALSMDPQYSATATLAKSYVVDAANWIARTALDGTGGTDPSTRGALYGVGGGVCTPGNDTNGCRCGPNSPSCSSAAASRENMGEALGELSLAYLYAPTPSLQAAIDNVFSAVYAKNSTDPGYDGTYAIDLESWFWGSNNSKWLGFFWGMGRNLAYMSARQGGLSVPANQLLYIDGEIGSVPGAKKMLVSGTDATGAPIQGVTCAVTPCALPIDKSLGTLILQISYLSTDNRVLSTGTPFPVVIQ